MSTVHHLQVVRNGGHNRLADQTHAQAGDLTVAGAVTMFLYARERAETTRQNIKDNLLGGRFRSWREDRGITLIRDLDAEAAVAYLTDYRQHRGAAKSTIVKVRNQLRELGTYLREQHGLDQLDRPPLTSYAVPDLLPTSPGADTAEEEQTGLSHVEAQMLLDAAKPGRDRVAVAVLLYCGLRSSELIGLRITDVELGANPPHLRVQGTVHHKTKVKTEAGYRMVPTVMGQRRLTAELRRYLEPPASKQDRTRRPRDTASDRLLLSTRRDPAGGRAAWSQDGLEEMLDGLGKRTGIHCNPHRFRHSCCTWLVDAGMHPQHLMAVMGWRDEAMVSRYYRGRTSQAVLEAAARVRAY